MAIVLRNHSPKAHMPDGFAIWHAAVVLVLLGCSLLWTIGLPSSAHCQQPRSNRQSVLVCSDGTAVEAILLGVTEEGTLQFARGEETFTLRPENVVRWGNFTLPTGQTALLSPRSLLPLVAFYFSESNVTIVGRPYGQVSVALDRIRALLYCPADYQFRSGPVLLQLMRYAEAIDTLILKNGDQLRGKLLDVGQTLKISTDLGTLTFPAAQVVACAFGTGSRSHKEKPEFVVGFRSGGYVAARSLQPAREGELAVITPWNEKLELRLSDVAAIQRFGEPVVYLSDLPVESYRHIPYLNLSWPYKLDATVTGALPRVDSKLYLKAIGMHSASAVTFRLQGRYQSFGAEIALDSTAGPQGSVRFLVFGDGKQLYASQIIRGGEPPQRVYLDVANIDRLDLIVEYGDWGDVLDRALWLDPFLIEISEDKEAQPSAQNSSS